MGRGMRGRKERGASFHGEHRSHEIRDWKLLTEEQVRGWVSGLTLRITQTSASTFAVECQLEKKKKSHNPKVELFSLVEKLKPPNLGGSISVALRKLLQGGGRWSQAIYKFATKGAGSPNIKDYDEVRKIRYQVYEFRVLPFMGRRKPLGSLKSLLSYAPQLSGADSCFLIAYILNSLFTSQNGRLSGWLLAFPRVPQQSPS